MSELTGDPNRRLPYLSNTIHQNHREEIESGKELIIKIPDAEVVTLTLRHKESGKVVMIDQSHAEDEDRDASTANLILKAPDSSPLTKGAYWLNIWYWDKEGDNGVGKAGGTKDVLWLT